MDPEIKSLAHSLLGDKALQDLVKFRQNVASEFFDGITRNVPRSIHLILNGWRNSPAEFKEASEVFKRYEGGDVIDIGAFHGFYSLLLAPKAAPKSQFLSLEPDRRIYSELLYNLSVASALFPHTHFSSLCRAGGDGTPSHPKYFSGEEGHPSFLSNSGTDPAHSSVTIDSLVETLNLTPQLIKIDVEGAEGAVLQGMQKTLREIRPSLMLELHPPWLPENVTVESIRTELKSLGYQPSLLNDCETAIREWWSPT